MTQKEFITGCVKIFGLVVLLFGVLRFTNHALLAGTIHSSTLIMQKAMRNAKDIGKDDFQFKVRIADFSNKVQFNLYHLPFDVLQMGFGLYLCRREQGLVRFLLK